MTKEEAANIISGYEVYGCGYCLTGGDEVEEALRMAIDALKELPTVEAIPVEFIKSEIKENKGFYNSNLRRLLDMWAERKEE